MLEACTVSRSTAWLWELLAETGCGLLAPEGLCRQARQIPPGGTNVPALVGPLVVCARFGTWLSVLFGHLRCGGALPSHARPWAPRHQLGTAPGSPAAVRHPTLSGPLPPQVRIPFLHAASSLGDPSHPCDSALCLPISVGFNSVSNHFANDTLARVWSQAP